MAKSYRTRPNEGPMPDPLAFFLTWTTYGTWLPGDERGWVKRGKGFQMPNLVRKRATFRQLKEDPCRLDAQQHNLVETTIAEHCTIRGWQLHVVNCRTNHVHVVVSAYCDPEVIRNQFKAWSTRKLNELQSSREAALRRNWWTERGSERYINDERSLEEAIVYVRDFQ